MKLNRSQFTIKYPAIMGICNITKDSFSDGGLNYQKKDALKNIKLMLKNGASIIDIGAESARPGSDPISYKEEIKRLDPILKVLPKNKFLISVDTYKIETQEFVLSRGAHIINDIFGGSTDLFALSKKYKNGLVLMHTPAPPKIMQQKTTVYKDVVEDIKKFFKQKLKQIDKVKIPQNKIWFDPGIGFGKNLKQNLLIIKNIKKLKLQKCGLLLGASRKSWISGIDDSPIEKRLGGSIASVLYCLDQEVDVFRVHDVFETRQAIEVYKKISCLR